ncbi:MAG: hypothetical protein IT427_20110 [Pirellulales bacterium]|nr:hypothetical protein [Pirellulales bacterium]
MTPEKCIEPLKASDRCEIVGRAKNQLKRFEPRSLAKQRRAIRDGLEAKLCTSLDDGEKTSAFCRSRDRQRKKQAKK